MRALAALVLLLCLAASAASGFAGGAPGCCARPISAASGSDPCGDSARAEPGPFPCCEMLPAEATSGRDETRDAVRPLAPAAGTARQIASLRAAPPFSRSLALARPLQAAPDSTIVLRI